MSKPLPNFLFHIPHMRGGVIDAEKLEKKMTTQHPPVVVRVIDSSTHREIGKMHPSIALAKFR